MSNTDQDFHPLLPKYLDKGSQGVAVNAVIHVLMATTWDDLPLETGNLGSLAKELLPDGEYGDALANFIMEAQSLSQNSDNPIGVDGNLGPDTREFLRGFEVDLNALQGTVSCVTQCVTPDGTFMYSPGEELTAIAA